MRQYAAVFAGIALSVSNSMRKSTVDDFTLSFCRDKSTTMIGTNCWKMFFASRGSLYSLS